jgi:hypothetical protein
MPLLLLITMAWPLQILCYDRKRNNPATKNFDKPRNFKAANS